MLDSKYLFLALIGVNILGLGLFLLKKSEVPQEPLQFDTYTNVSNSIKVDIEGAVVHPGVYQLTDNLRIADAIASAGGVLSDVDQSWLDKYINLSQTLSDEQKIFIPEKSSSSPAANKISINASEKTALVSLKGIGDILADKIIASRPYSDINELWEKKIISKKVFDQISDQISLW